MNDRLEDLMYESGLTAQGCWDSMDDYDREAIEKFANLILEECAARAEVYAHMSPNFTALAEEIRRMKK
jgi:hypothetical protein